MRFAPRTALGTDTLGSLSGHEEVGWRSDGMLVAALAEADTPAQGVPEQKAANSALTGANST